MAYIALTLGAVPLGYGTKYVQYSIELQKHGDLGSSLLFNLIVSHAISMTYIHYCRYIAGPVPALLKWAAKVWL